MKMSLEMAKKNLESEKVFLNGSKFSFCDTGKYRPGITFIIGNDWVPYYQYVPSFPEKALNPVWDKGYENADVKNYIGGMNVDFDASSADICFGRYRISKTGKPVFELTQPTQSHHAMIQVDWGGAFAKHFGKSKYELEKDGVFNQLIWYSRRSSNGGGCGNDFYIVPVDWVANAQSRNVKEFLRKFEEQELLYKNKNESLYRENKERYTRKRDFYDTFLKETERIVKEKLTVEMPWVKVTGRLEDGYYPRVKIETLGEDANGVFHRGTGYNFHETVPEELKNVEKLCDNILDNIVVAKKMKEELEELLPSEMLNGNISVEAFETRPEIYYVSEKSGTKCFRSVDEVVEFVNEEFKKEEESRKEALRKAAEIAAKEREEEARQDAIRRGYPSSLSFPNRLGGKTNLCHTYVITMYGDRRAVSDNALRNSNHRFHSDWVELADGVQTYDQIYPGDLVISFEKEFTAAPLKYTVNFLPGEIESIDLSEDQIDALEELFREHLRVYEPTKVLFGEEEIKTPEELSKHVDDLNKKVINK